MKSKKTAVSDKSSGSKSSHKKQVLGFIKKFDPKIAKLVTEVRSALRRRYPTAIELVYDNYNALAIGLSPTEKTSDAFVSIAVYARGVNLYFIHGAKLTDPQRLLEGNGNQGRFFRVQSAADVATPPVLELLTAAIRFGEVPLPSGTHGYTVVKSISAKQRPRRPVKR